MLDDIKVILKHHFCGKNIIVLSYVPNVVVDIRTFPKNLSTTTGLSILLHGVILLPDATSYDKIDIKTDYHNDTMNI